MASSIEKVGSAELSSFVRRCDATHDEFVSEHMAGGERIVSASKYVQSKSSCIAQIAAIGVPVAMLGLVGPPAAALLFGGFAVAMLGFELTNRVVITEASLVLQTSLVVRRFERGRIENARVENLSFRHWVRFELFLLDPTYFYRKAPGLRFQYRSANGKVTQVFVGTEDAHILLGRLGA